MQRADAYIDGGAGADEQERFDVRLVDFHLLLCLGVRGYSRAALIVPVAVRDAVCIRPDHRRVIQLVDDGSVSPGPGPGRRLRLADDALVDPVDHLLA